jgi:eukaryotic-like serine/threonine-protein kinase
MAQSAELPDPDTSATSTARGVRVRLLGRDAELTHLLALLTAATQGSGSTALIVDEAGIGKTRLAEELAAAAHGRDALVLWGRCAEREGAPAYWPWVQILRGLIRRLPTPALAEVLQGDAPIVAQLLPELHQRLPGLPEPSVLGPDQARFRLFEALATFVTSQSAQTRLVLIIDDLHWADLPTLLLLEFLARDVHALRVLLVATCRDVDLGWKHPLTHTLSELARQHVHRFDLHGLGREDTTELVEATTGAIVQPALVDAIQAATDGNPFFTSEVVRWLASEGRLGNSAGSRLGIPPSVRDVIGRRLSRLSDTASHALLAGAVLGREFDFRAVAHVLDSSGAALTEVTDAMDEALAARLIVEHERSPGRFSFTHALVRQTLDELIGSAPRRAQMHQRCGAAIESLYATSLGEHYAELAHHYLQAGQAALVARGIEDARRAGEQALAQLAYEQAVAHFERALQALPLKSAPSDSPSRERAELLLALGDAQTHAGALESAARTFREVAQLARRDGLSDVLARAAIGFGGPTEKRGYRSGLQQRTAC